VVLGNQAFVICPRIEASKKEDKEKKSSWDEVKAVKEEYEKLDNDIFPDLRVAMLHGKMKTKERNKIMLDFKNKKIDILVATSVVEVGVDIPQATVMVIEGAERFGLAQLHQFRGRVGRSDQQAYCFLFSDSNSQKTHQRLRAIVKAEDGFQLAQKDLEIRGPGSLYGLKQWGIPDLAMKNLGNLPLVEKTREKAKELLREDSSLKDFPLLKRELAGVSKSLHLE
jgi:ATP-dependent DNA helicase RecG